MWSYEQILPYLQEAITSGEIGKQRFELHGFYFFAHEYLRWLDPVFFRGYHPTLKLYGIPTFTFIVSLTHRMDNIYINLQYNIKFLAIGINVTWL